MKYSSLQRDALELHRDLQQRIVAMAELGQHLVRGLLHDLGARIVVLVDAVAEAHQAEIVLRVLGALDVFRDAVDGADLAEHLQRRLVGAAVRRAPEAAMPAAMQANGLAPDEPASRTVEVEAFCSWSACRMKMRSIARASTGLAL